MSTDEEHGAVDAIDVADAAGASGFGDQRGSAPDDTVAALRDVESRPLSERAQGYQELADRLRADLEHSDPSRDPS